MQGKRLRGPRIAEKEVAACIRRVLTLPWQKMADGWERSCQLPRMHLCPKPAPGKAGQLAVKARKRRHECGGHVWRVKVVQG